MTKAKPRRPADQPPAPPITQQRAQVRGQLLEGAQAAVPVLLAQLRMADSDPALAQAAADKLLKYGIGTQREVTLSIDDIRERMRQTVGVLQRELPPEAFTRIAALLKPIWS